MEYFCTHTQSIRETRSTNRHNHKLLKIYRIISMATTIKNVHHRYRQSTSTCTTDVAIKFLVGFHSSCFGTSQRYTKDSIITQFTFIWSTIYFYHTSINSFLLCNVHTSQFFIQNSIYILNSFQNAFSHKYRFIAITKFTCFMNTGRSTRWNGSTTKCTTFCVNIYFDSRITSRI